MPEPTTSGLTDEEWLAIHRMADEAEELRTEVRRLQDGIREVADDLDRDVAPGATTIHEVKLRTLIGDDRA